MKEGTEASQRHALLVAAAREYKEQGHTHAEVAQKFGKSEAWSLTWCKGIAPQPSTSAGNQYTSGKFDRIANAKKVIAKYNSDWDYAGDFTGTDGTVRLRCKTCGSEVIRSMITIRHQHCACDTCEKKRREARARAKAQTKAAEKFRIEAKTFRKSEQLSMTFCELCGVSIISSRARRCQACSDAIIHRAWNIKKQRRAKAAMTKDSASITVKALFERDAGICWLCGGACDITADPNANDYPSIDHVLPISKGGKDTWKNVRLAHRYCNSVRSNRENVTEINYKDCPPVAIVAI